MVSQWPREGRHRRGFRREFFFGDDKLYACVKETALLAQAGS